MPNHLNRALFEKESRSLKFCFIILINLSFLSRVNFWKFLKILVENITGEPFKRLEKRRRQSTDQSIDSILNNLLYMYDYRFPFFFFFFLNV